MHFLYLFAYTICLSMVLPLFSPFWHLLYFAPFLILSFYRHSLIGCLWWSIASGLIVDLFSADTRLGNHAMNYCLTTFCLYRYQFHFFEDRLSTLPIMTFGFACLSTLIQIAIFYVINKPFSLSWIWAIEDLVLSPIQVALYAVLAFALPNLILSYLKRHSFLFRLARRKR